MFQQRQLNEVYSLVEVSFSAAVNPGGIATGAKAAVTVQCVLGGTGSTQNATFTQGDRLEVIPPAAAGVLGGLIIDATPAANAGQATINFFNAGAGTVTPTSAQWTVIAKRIAPNTF